MSQLRPKHMTQGEFAELLREHGFVACSKAAVSLAERSKESGVQFTPEARNVARGLFKSIRRSENRANPNKTTVWLDDDTRIWLEERAYMEDSSVGAVIRGILEKARFIDRMKKANQKTEKQMADRLSALHEKAASGAGTSEAAQREGNMAFPLPSEDITETEENQA